MDALYEKNYSFNSVIPDFPAYYGERHLNLNSESCPLHWHEWIELLYIVSGEISIWCNGGITRIAPGRLFIVNPYEFHSTVISADNTLNIIVQIDLNMLKSVLGDQCDEQYIQKIIHGEILFHSHTLPSERLIGQITQIGRVNDLAVPGKELLIKAELFTLLYRLLEECSYKPANYRKRDKQTISHQKLIVDNALTYMNNHFGGAIGLRDIAKASEVSESYLSHLFKEELSISPVAYLNGQRCAYAANLLLTTDLNVKEVSLASGFGDSNYFSRIFKKKMGLSPQEYRITRAAMGEKN